MILIWKEIQYISLNLQSFLPEYNYSLKNENLMKKMPLLKENEKFALEEFKKSLSLKFNLLDFRLYGSKARGDAQPDSDIDVMIKLEKYTPDIVMEIYHIAFNMDLNYDSFISPVIFSMDELENGPLSESPLYKTIMKEGIPL